MSESQFSFFKLDFYYSTTWQKQTPYRYSADAKEIIQNTHDFYEREKEDGLKIALNQVKERASTGVSKSMIEWVMRRDKATEQKPQLTRAQFKASLA